MAPTAPLIAVEIPSNTFFTIIFANDLANAVVLVNADRIIPRM